MKDKVVFIVGPTAVGKTDLAFRLAKKFNGELVSADSIQVYQGLDIISGKDLPKGYSLNAGYYSSNSGPSIYLLDVVNPTSSFDVAQFYGKASSAINAIFKKGKLPIVVGGTGLYVEVLLNGLTQSAGPDFKRREQLNNSSIEELQQMFSEDELKNLNASDVKNKRRLIRRIELRGKKGMKVKKIEPNYEHLVVGLTCEREELKKKIEKRVDIRLKNGALDEVKKLFNNYYLLAQQVKDANGYKQLFNFLKGEVNFDEAILRWKISEYKHAKNQMTWFKKYGNVEWIDINDNSFTKKIEKRLQNFLK